MELIFSVQGRKATDVSVIVLLAEMPERIDSDTPLDIVIPMGEGEATRQFILSRVQVKAQRISGEVDIDIKAMTKSLEIVVARHNVGLQTVGCMRLLLDRYAESGNWLFVATYTLAIEVCASKSTNVDESFDSTPFLPGRANAVI